MAKINLFNWDYENVGDMELPDEVFNVPLKRHLLWEYVRIYRANQRQGTASTKTRADVRGGGKKPWRQKGTGRARIGTIRSPLWNKGGIVHGPHPRDFSMKMNKKQKQLALRVALSQRFRDDDLLVLDSFELPDHRTKNLHEKISKFPLGSGVLFVDTATSTSNLYLASRNIPKVTCKNIVTLNAYDIISHRKIVFSKPAIETISEGLKS